MDGAFIVSAQVAGGISGATLRASSAAGAAVFADPRLSEHIGQIKGQHLSQFSVADQLPAKVFRGGWSVGWRRTKEIEVSKVGLVPVHRMLSPR